MFILNYLYFLILTGIGIKFLFLHHKRVRNPLHKKQYLLFDGPELFWALTFSTGLLALSAPGALDLMAIRLLVLEIFCFVGLFIVKRRAIWTLPIVLYLIYLFWITIGLTYTPSAGYGIRVIMKYIYPLLVMLFASAVVRHQEVLFKAGLGARTVALICIGVMFIPFVAYLFPGVFWYATALAINFIVMCVFSLALYFHGGKDKKDLILAIVFAIPCILWIFRTSIMGTTLALMVFFFFRYKLKSLPVIVGMLGLFVSAIFFIPSVKDKMFKKEGTNKDISMLQSGEISKDDIDSNGRFAMWEWSMDKFFKNKELQGTGTGNLQETFYALRHPFGSIRICHNDYVQILCDNGLIGISLFLSSFLLMIGHCFVVYQQKRYTTAIRICAITAGASIAGILLTMYTDNVINYSMATLSYPCGFYGMMLGLIYAFKHKRHAVQQS